MAKQNNAIFWIVGIVVLVFLILPNLQKTPIEEGMIGLTPHYYKDGVEVFPQKGFLGFSVVTPPGGTYDQISFDISATNLGDIPIEDIKVVNAYPQVFKDALVEAIPQTLAIQETKTLWTSGLIDTEQFEAVSPVNFWIEISGENTYTEETTYPDRAYSGDISFEAEGPSPTQTFFSTFFSIVDFGGQTYHNDRGYKGGSNVIFTDYSGSGYYTGFEVITAYDSYNNCKVFIDGIEYLSFGAVEFYAHDFGVILDDSIVRFENSLKVQCSGTSGEQWVYSVSYMAD